MQTFDYDLCVIGGGINGVGVARDAAGRGLSVLLLEAGDLGNMTSSASSKMLHGGLRYLEQFEFGLVREALRERQTILKIAPHISKPMDFILPHGAGQRPVWMIRLGLFLYDYLAGRKKLKSSKKINLQKESYGAPLQERFSTGFVYTDGQVDDARLVVLNALDAAEKGADIYSYTPCQSIEAIDGGWRIYAEDKLRGQAHVFSAETIINAAGPAANKVLSLEEDERIIDRRDVPQLRLVKGSHIVTKKLYEGDHGYLFQNDDKRVLFMWPFEGAYTLIGTTEEEFDGHPKDAQPSDEEIQYLLEAINKNCKTPITRSDIVAQFSGVRPLVDSHDHNARTVSRRHVFHDYQSASGGRLLSIYGGKLTTYRLIAQELVDLITGQKDNWTAKNKLPGGQFSHASFSLFLNEKIEQYNDLEARYVTHLCTHYGARIDRVLDGARHVEDLGVHYGDDLYECEIRYVVRHEFARTMRDILWRRTKRELFISKETRKALAKALPVILEEEGVLS